MTTEEQLKLLRGRLAPLREQFDSIIEQVNELFETGYNEFIDAAEDPDDEETADAAAVWDCIFDDSASIAEVIDAIDAAVGEE
jgi:hypothetical protein